MKIFISHSSKNKQYGDKLVELLRSIGLKEEELIFTSNIAYGIPVGQNIFNWLKSQINEKPFVIYLLSEEYYQSIACLNEMGAAWIIESKHAAVFTPNFNLSSKEFQSGALDPRELGFFINDEERVLSFIQVLSDNFAITKSPVLISQSVRKFIHELKSIEPNKSTFQTVQKAEPKELKVMEEKYVAQEVATKNLSADKEDIYGKFVNAVIGKKLKEEELILLKYIIDTGRIKLMVGWQEEAEASNIREWEQINEVKNILSKNYGGVIKRFEIRGFTETSAVTASSNPKEVKIKAEISSKLLDLPTDILEIIEGPIKRNFFEYNEDPNTGNDLAFL